MKHGKYELNPMKKAVFTIVSKNYLSRAFTLGESVKRNNSNVDFYIMLADEFAEDEAVHVDYPIIECKEFMGDCYLEMAYKYDILEFNTSIKPYCFLYLFSQSYYKVIYFDPDIYVYDNLDVIYDELNKKSIILTPHILDAEEEYSGCFDDKLLLFEGIYNLGFIALANNDIGKKIAIWWRERLFNACYADPSESLHTDQKWMDFIPGFYPEDTWISHHLGMNVAAWNLHQRMVYRNGNKWLVKSLGNEQKECNLIFFHFSGFDPDVDDLIHKKQDKYFLSNRPEMKELFLKYKSELLQNGYHRFLELPYKYNTYENGERITHTHRRMYRALLEKNIKYNNPFFCGQNTYYELLKNSKLIVPGAKNDYDRLSVNNIKGFRKKDYVLKRLLCVLKFLIGTRNYLLLMRWLKNNTRPETQVFLFHIRDKMEKE